MNGGMHGSSLTGIRGPFTPAQWIELEHQAMIYKYFIANVPVPSNLLIPIKKAIQSAVFPGFSFGSYPSHSYGWGSFHLGFSGNTDPEPGRCRRTDGKKWRCSRDAVPDQKYCERHINRGRHRSRKPVEGHTGHAASGVATSKVVLPPMPSLVTSVGGVSNGDATVQHQMKGFQPTGVIDASTDPISKRLTDQQGLSLRTTTINVESKDSQCSIPKQHIPYNEPSVSEFGIVSNDSLLNPSQKSSYLDSKSYNSLLEFNTEQNQDQFSLRHFTDNWPKDPSHGSALPWPKDVKSDWTQLSMSIPVSKDFSLSSSSTNQKKVDTSPLQLSHEPDPSQTGLRVGTIDTKQNLWIPIPEENSMGGPLGEVLLNNSSPKLGSYSSPSGISQKSTFVSVSRSSLGGSPRGEKRKTVDGASLCDDLLGLSAHATCASIPSM
ncbi:hypothetical protein RND81_02G137800 [Saponaria officinalis]